MTLSKEKINSILLNYQKYGSLKKVSKMVSCSPNTVKKYASLKFKIKTQEIINNLHSKDGHLVGLYVGLWTGDGTQYFEKHYRVKICSNKNQKKLNQFIETTISQLFNKSSAIIYDKSSNSAYIKFSSKFIFNFVKTYVTWKGSKTYSVKLKRPVTTYSTEFLEGFLLGLALSDGYLKNEFHFNTTSKYLCYNIRVILKRLKMHPKLYIHKRKKYGWHDLYMLRLDKFESGILESRLNNTLRLVNCHLSFKELKYE